LSVLASTRPRRSLAASPTTPSAPARLAAALLALALLLGGGGTPFPLNEMLLEWAAVAALGWAAWRADGASPRAAMACAAALLALLALQLVPLPPWLWQSLPGRETERAALALIGAERAWMPLSVSPARTLASLLSLLVPLAMLLLAARLSRRGQMLCLKALATVALASVIVGAAQLAAGANSPLRFYSGAHAGYLTGFQANRNHQADVLLIGMVALAAWRKATPSLWHEGGRQAAWWAAMALLGGGVLLTVSRTGMALLVATGLGLWLWLRPRRRPNRGEVAGLATVAVALAGAAWLARGSAAAERIASRLEQSDDPRPDLWTDTAYAIAQHWPFGSGFGTFPSVFVAAERLEVVDPSRPNRAHNDYLELTLEAGLPGLVMLAILAAYLAWRLFAALRAERGSEARATLVFAGSALGLLALHSIVDYPLRSMALAAIAGLAAGIILASGVETARAGAGERRAVPDHEDDKPQ
jgi:O-antigen ligase